MGLSGLLGPALWKALNACPRCMLSRVCYPADLLLMTGCTWHCFSTLNRTDRISFLQMPAGQAVQDMGSRCRQASLLEDASLLPHPTRISVLEQGLYLICWLVRRGIRRGDTKHAQRASTIAHAWVSPCYPRPELVCLMHLCSWPAEHSATSTPSEA